MAPRARQSHVHPTQSHRDPRENKAPKAPPVSLTPAPDLHRPADEPGKQSFVRALRFRGHWISKGTGTSPSRMCPISIGSEMLGRGRLWPGNPWIVHLFDGNRLCGLFLVAATLDFEAFLYISKTNDNHNDHILIQIPN